MAEEDRYANVQKMFRNARLGGGGTDSTNAELKTRKEAGFTGGSLSIASGRPRDPMWYWKQSNLPYNIWDDVSGAEMRRVREFCNTPDAPVWMGDFSFKEIGQIVVGDEVIGWDRYETGSGPRGASQQKTHLVRTKVLAVNRRIAPMIVKITMESGRVIRCTPDHKWANYNYSPGDPRAQEFVMPGLPNWRKPGHGSSLRRVIDPTPELSSDKERLAAAWLGGLYDGEGHAERIAQSIGVNGDVCERIRYSLDLLGIRYSANTASGSDCVLFSIGSRGDGNRGKRGAGSESRQDLVNFLNWCEPTRRSRDAVADKLLTSNYGQQDSIVSIEEEGPGEVVAMQTETGNYTAWGYASSNCRLLYVTHPLLGSAIDIYAKYPLAGMEVTCGKDRSIAAFYEDLFMNDLNYEEFLPDVGREHWLVGEAFPLGGFNELAGVWESDDLMLPEDVNVIKTPFANRPRFEMALPWNIRKILNDRAPRLEYTQLIEHYPEFLALNFSDWQPIQDDRFMIPVSDGLMQQVMRKGDSFHPRGIPIMMRAFRAVAQEEMLMAASDSISQRLYTPLILAKIGASATDLGTDTPWVPTQGDLDAFVEDVNAALAADFRLIVTHFAAQMQNVFGRESMPDLTRDFDRLEEKMLQAFGMSKTMVSGASGGDTYAADALNRDLVTQLLSEYQRKMKRFFRNRCEIVAEAQGHYDFERKGGRSVPIMERRQEVDPETGDVRFVERPKLLLPELRIKAMNMRDEQQVNDLLDKLRQEGVPISQRSRLTNVPIDLDEEVEAVVQEQVEQAVLAQRVRKRTYERLTAEKLPVDEDLAADFRPRVLEAAPGGAAPASEPDPAIPTLGTVDPNTGALVPGEDEAAAAEEVKAPERRNRVLDRSEQSHRPPESDEQRADMPKAAAWRKTAAALGVDDAVITFAPVIQKRAVKVDEDGNTTGGDEQEMEMPVIGSFKLRHRGHRDPSFFYLDSDRDDAAGLSFRAVRVPSDLSIEAASDASPDALLLD